jgi:hypothetical protein
LINLDTATEKTQGTWKAVKEFLYDTSEKEFGARRIGSKYILAYGSPEAKM